MGIITTNEGMTSSAMEMRTRRDSINNIITKMAGYVEEMNFQAQSATNFRLAMGEWTTKARTITLDLESMADRLDGGGDNVLTTEQTNQITGKFF